VGGGSSLCLLPGGGAGLSLRTPLNASARHCGGTPASRRRTDAPRRRREPPSLRLLAEMPRDAGPLWSRGSCASSPRPRRTAGVRDPSDMQRPMRAFWQPAETPGGDAVEEAVKMLRSPLERRRGVARLLCAASGAAEF
jgi:hypothetical protein